MRAKVRDVEPFNDIYTHDCFMNALLCTAKHYHLDYPLLTLHRTFFYSFADEQLEGISFIQFPIEELAAAVGLEMIREKDDLDYWKEQYHMAFKRGDIIVAPLDDYYNPLRADIYNKEHLPHFTLSYRMDDGHEALAVIESKYRMTVSYKKMIMRYSDYEKAHFQTETMYKYVLRKSTGQPVGSYRRKYLQQKVYWEEQSLAAIDKYMDFLPQKGMADKAKWLKNLNNLCNQTKVERYIFEKVFNNPDLAAVSAEIYKIWYLVRTYAVKFPMLEYAGAFGAKIRADFNQINELQQKKLRLLYTFEK